MKNSTFRSLQRVTRVGLSLILALAMLPSLAFAAPVSPLAELIAVPDVLEVGPFHSPPAPSIGEIAWDRIVQKQGYDKKSSGLAGALLGGLTQAYTPATSAQYNGYATPDHIVTLDDGSMNFLGYARGARTDYAWSENADYELIDSMTFTLRPQAMNFHTFAQAGFLFNGKLQGDTYTGYAVAISSPGEGRTASLGLYKGTWNINGYIPESARVATYASGIASGSRDPYTIRFEVDPTKDNRPFSIYVNGNLKTSAASDYGMSHGIGYLTSYYDHNCFMLTVIKFSSIALTMDPSATDPDLIPVTDVKVRFKVGNTEIAAPQIYSGKVACQDYTVREIPETITYDGVTYKALFSEPESFLSKDINGKYLFKRTFGDGSAPPENPAAPYPSDKEIVIQYDNVELTKSAEVKGISDNGRADDPVIVENGDEITYTLKPQNAGNPYTGTNMSQPPSSWPFTTSWGSYGGTQSNYTGPAIWGKSTYMWNRGDTGMNTAGTYKLTMTYPLKKGVYTNVGIPIGQVYGNLFSSNSNNPYNFHTWMYGTKKLTIELHRDSATGPIIWQSVFDSDEKINGAANANGVYQNHTVTQNETGNAFPTLNPPQQIAYGDLDTNKRINFGTIAMPADGNIVMVCQTNAMRNYRMQSKNDQMTFGLLAGTLTATAKPYVEDVLPGGLSYVKGSAVISNSGSGSSGVSVIGQRLFWDIDSITNTGSYQLSFKTKVTAAESLRAVLNNTATLALPAATGSTSIASNKTYHLKLGSLVVNERYVDYLTGEELYVPLDGNGQPDGTIKDSSGNDLVNPGKAIIPDGGTYTKTPTPSISVSSGSSGSTVTYEYKGYFWDDAPAKWVSSTLPLTAGALDNKDLGGENCTVTYVYKDSRVLPEITEKYRLYDVSGDAPTDNPVRQGGEPKADTKTELGVGDDYGLPQGKTQDIKDGAASYTYVGYSVDGGKTVKKDGDKYPAAPLWAELAAGSKHVVILYFAGNPVYTAKFRLCDMDGTPLSGGSPSGSVPQGWVNAGTAASKPDEVRTVSYGDPLYFQTAYTNPVKGTYTKDANGQPEYNYYKYYGYQVGTGSITPGAPSDSLLADSLTQNYEITLYYVDAKQVKVRFVEQNNAYGNLKAPVLLNRRAGEDVEASVLAASLTPITITEDRAASPPKTREYTYKNYKWEDMEDAAEGEPTGVSNLQTDKVLTLYFSTNYDMTIKYHTNVTPTDDAQNPVVPYALYPQQKVSAVGGGKGDIASPPGGIRYDNKVWNYAGYKIGSDSSALKTGLPTPSDGSSYMSWGAYGPLWSDIELILAYNPDQSKPLYTVTVEAPPVTTPGGAVYGCIPEVKSESGTSVKAGLVLPVTGRVDDILPGETVTLDVMENAGYAFSSYKFYDGAGTEIDPDAIRFASDGGKGGSFIMPSNTVRVVVNYVATTNTPTLLVNKDGIIWETPQNMDGKTKNYFFRCTSSASPANIGKDYAGKFDRDGIYKFPQMPDGSYTLYEGVVDKDRLVGSGTDTGIPLTLDGGSPRLRVEYYTLNIGTKTENHYPAGYTGAKEDGGTANRSSSGIYLAGSTIPISALATAGFSFKGWEKLGNSDPGGVLSDSSASAGGSGTGANIKLPAAGVGAVTINAQFERSSFPVTVEKYKEDPAGIRTLDSADVGGSVAASYVVGSTGVLGGAISDSGAVSVSAGSLWYYGLPVSLTATPANGYAFAGWELAAGDGTLVRNTSVAYAGFTPGIGIGSNDIVLKAVFREVSQTSVTLSVGNETAIDGGTNGITVDATNLFPVATAIKELKWFREELNSNQVTSRTAGAFDQAYASASDRDKGVLAAEDFSGFAGTAAHRSGTFGTDENGRYWVSVSYEGHSQDGSLKTYTCVAYVDVKNIYTAYEIYQRDYNQSMSYIVKAYTALPPNQIAGVSPPRTAIPFDLHGAAKASGGTVGANDVLAADGVTYRSVTFAPTKPNYIAVYNITLPGGAKWEAAGDDLTVMLDKAFFEASGLYSKADTGAGLGAGHYYSVTYTMDESKWTNAAAYYVKADGSSQNLPQEEGPAIDHGPIKVVPKTDGKLYNELGGVFFPPSGAHLVPVGWYIAENASSRTDGGAAGACGPTDTSYRALTDFTNMDADFTALIHSLTDTDAPDQHVYIVYEEEYRVDIHHYLYAAGAATNTKVAADSSVVVKDTGGGTGPFSNVPLDLTGFVVVGAQTTSTATFKSNAASPSYASGGRLGDGSGNPAESISGTGMAKFPFVGAAGLSQAVFFSVEINPVSEDVTLNYYYEKTEGSSGIPSSDFIAVMARFLDGAGAPVALDKIYTARKGQPLVVTNDNSPDGGEAHAITPSPVDPTKPNAKWVFNPALTAAANPNEYGNNAPGLSTHPEKWTVTANADARILFYYDYATNGTTSDKSQWIRTYYTGFGGAVDLPSVKLKEPETSISLMSAEYTKEAPSFPGYLYKGLYKGVYDGGATGAMPSGLDPAEVLQVAASRQDATQTWTFVYEPGMTFAASADGVADKKTSQMLTLEFSAPVKNLSAGDLSFAASGTGSATFGAPAGRNGSEADGYRTWLIPVTGVSPGAATVQITKGILHFVPAAQDVDQIHLSKGPALVSAAFDGVEDRVTTSTLTLTFDKPITDLNTLMDAGVRLGGQGILALASLTHAVPGVAANDPEYGKIWKVSVSNVSVPGTVELTLALPSAHYTLAPNSASSTVFAERRYLVYHTGSAPYVTGTPPLSEAGANYGALFTAQFTQTLEGEGTLFKPGYVFYGWSETDSWIPGARPSVTRFRGEKIDLDASWTIKEGADTAPVGATDLYPVWLAPPHPRLNAPVVGADGSAMLTGRVVRATHDYTVKLEYREVGTANWTLLFEEGPLGLGGSQEIWRFFDSSTEKPAYYIPASKLTPGRQYEVRLTATDAEVAKNAPSAYDIAAFRMPSQKNWGMADIPGIVDNQTGAEQKVIVTLQEGNVVIDAPIVLTVGAGGSERFTFGEISDGYYNVVVDFDGQRITRGVRVYNNKAYEVISCKSLDESHLLTFSLGRKQSRVTILPGAPPASVDGLPELFEVRSIFDPVLDILDAVINTGGLVELNLLVNYLGSDNAANAAKNIPAEDRAAINGVADKNKHTVLEYYDLSLIKTRYDHFGVIVGDPQSINNLGKGNKLVVSFRIPDTISKDSLVAIYRTHGVDAYGKPKVDVLGRGAENKNAEGEYFEVDGAYVLIHVMKFSTYALSVKPAVKDGEEVSYKAWSDRNGSRSANTGDDANMNLWIWLEIISGLAILLIMLTRKQIYRKARKG